MKFYFAHNFYKRKEYRKLELQLEEELGIELFNPFYDDDSRIEEMAELDNSEDKFNRNEESADYIVKRDLKNLADCDVLFTIIEEPSFGTCIEIANAILMRKKVWIVTKKYLYHPWIKVYADKRFESIDEFKITYKTFLSK